nr:MAG TPA: hypothetical protein [Caudoviricetes sp.]
MYYVDEYHKSEDSNIKDLWYSLAQLHIDGYNKTRMVIASYVSKYEKEYPNIATIWIFIRDMQNDFLDAIKKQM